VIVNIRIRTGTFIPTLENLVLRAKSKKLGCAVVIYCGMMENWNVGMMGLMECGLFLCGWNGIENKI
jgi:hypothetical protein